MKMTALRDFFSPEDARLRTCFKKKKYNSKDDQADDIADPGGPVAEFFGVAADGVVVVPGQQSDNDPEKPMDMTMV